MEQQLELSAEKRVITGKQVKQLRRKGLIPAVVFGRAIEQPIAIQIPEKELRPVLVAGGTTRLISLKIKDLNQPTLALVREIQRDTLTSAVTHVDFQAIVMTEKLRTNVGLVFVGESPAVTDGTGMVLHLLDHVEVECLPADLISAIEVNLGSLAKVDDTILVSDLKVPPTIKILTPPDEPVARVVHALEIPAEEEVPAETASEPEVIRKGKVAEEETKE